MRKKTMETYHYVPETRKGGNRKTHRAAAYCRVSTAQEEQELSFETQQRYYQTMIGAAVGLELVGIYGDRGLSGTQAEKRPEFMRLIRDCRAGQIDVIYCRSVSRFARNFAECLQYARELKELGVLLIFEKEGIRTDDPSIELLFAMMAIVAQEESNSISQTISWAHQKRAAAGDPVRTVNYGYRRSKCAVNGVHPWHIEPEEARRVELAFRMAADGKTYAQIIRSLNAMEAEAGTQKKWYGSTLKNMLQNEVYQGDILTNKTYVVDYLTREIRENDGERPQYYLENHHEGIVSRELFAKVRQRLQEYSRTGRRGEK